MNRITESTLSTGLYIHIPFCQKKCPYCDFNTYAGLDSLFDETVEALCLELIKWSGHLQKRQINTVFLGGGTPSALAVPQLERLFDTIGSYYRLSNDCEITSEVNPGAVDRAKFTALKSLGVNRLSMGVQSFQEAELKFLGRIHTVEDVFAAYDSARDAGFNNINLDFMFGLPDQQHEAWVDTLRQALNLQPDHLSLYSLIVEQNTVLNHWVQTGKIPRPDEDQAADQYKHAIKTLESAGYMHYEVSNWSRTPELSCKHNLIYWRNHDYLGVGPGAHSHLRTLPASLTPQQMHPQLKQMIQQEEANSSTMVELRWGNRKPVPGYVKRVKSNQPLSEFWERPTQAIAMGETMMLGLRLLNEGVPFSRFVQHHGQDLRKVYAAEIDDLQEMKHIQVDDQKICLTSTGLMVGNQVFYRFLSI